MAGSKIEEGKGSEVLQGRHQVPAVVFARKEQAVILPSFSPEQRAALQGFGLSFFYHVAPKSLATLREESPDDFAFINSSVPLLLTPGATEVAFDPKNSIPPQSLQKNFSEQLQDVRKLDGEVRKRISGVGVGIAHVPVYPQLYKAHAAWVKEAPRGERERLVYSTWTSTETLSPYLVNVGLTRGEYPVSVYILDKNFSHPYLGVFPVAVPIG